MGFLSTGFLKIAYAGQRGSVVGAFAAALAKPRLDAKMYLTADATLDVEADGFKWLILLYGQALTQDTKTRGSFQRGYRG